MDAGQPMSALYNFSTDGLPEKERVEAWRENYARATLKLELEPARNIPFRACRSIDSASAAGPRPGIDLPGRRQTAHSSTSYSTRCGTRKRTSGERTDDCATSGADARARHRATARAYAAGRKREQADCQDHEQKIVTHLTSPLSASWVILENLLRRCGFAGGHRSAIALPRVKIQRGSGPAPPAPITSVGTRNSKALVSVRGLCESRESVSRRNGLKSGNLV